MSSSVSCHLVPSVDSALLRCLRQGAWARGLLLGLGIWAATLAGSAAFAQEKKAEAEGPVSFSKQVAPILVKSCLACHSAKDAKGGFQLHNFEMLLKPGDSSSPPITAGKLDESELYRLVSSTEKSERMPKDAEPLPAEQVAVIKRWIEEGAKFDGPDAKVALTSLVPKAAYPDPPEAYRVAVPVTALAFSPDGKELLVGGYHEITVWNPADGQLIRRIKNLAQRTYALRFSNDGKLLAVASGTPGQVGEVKLLNAADGTLERDLATMPDVAFDVAFSAAGDKLAACSADRTIRIFDVASGKEERVIEDHADWVMSIAWNPDGTRLASASRDKTSKVFDLKTGESTATYNGHNDTVYGVAFAADGTQVFSSGADRKIHVWSPGDAKKVAEITGFGLEVFELVIQGGQLFCCSADKTVRQFDAAKRSQTRSLTGHADWVYAVAYHEGTKRLASGGFDGEVRVWNAEDGSLVTSFRAAPGLPAPEAKPAAK